jgi:hypothetical protein
VNKRSLGPRSNYDKIRELAKRMVRQFVIPFRVRHVESRGSVRAADLANDF